MIDSNLLQPFLTYFREDPDYNSSDVGNEINLMLTRNQVIEEYLEGEKPEDYLLDLLAEQEIEPNMYLEAVQDEIHYLMTNPHLLYS